MPSPNDQPHPRQTRSRARRWLPRSIVAILTLILVVIVIAQIIFNTTIPKQIVIAQVQNALGLRVTARSLTTGWLGHTTLRDVQVSLPLSDKAVCSLPELRVTHTVLPILLLTQSVTIKSIELDHPTVTITQDKSGRWNVQDVAQVLARLGGQQQVQGQAQPTASKSSPFVIPNITLRDGDIEVTDNAGRHAALMPLEVNGRSEGSLVWKYDAFLKTVAGANASFAGRVVPSDNFTHEVDFDLSNLASLAKPWIPNFDPSATVNGHWKGSVANGGVSGRLQLNKLQYQTIAAESGDFTVQTANGGVTILPGALLVHAGSNSMSLQVAGGSIRADATSAKLNQLDLTALDGDVRLDGSLAYSDLSGSITATWNKLHPAASIDTTGSFTASLQPQWPDRQTINAQLVTSGNSLTTPYSADIRVTAVGKNWNAAQVTINAQTLRYDWKTPIRLDGLVAHVNSEPGRIALSDVSIARPDAAAAHVVGSGALQYDAKNPFANQYAWWLYLAGQNLTIPPIANAPIKSPTVAGDLNAWGNQQDICLQEAHAIVGSILATADGFYHITKPSPVDANITVAETGNSSALLADGQPTTNPTTSPAFVQGHLRGDSHLLGTLYPLNLSLTGQLHGRGLVVDNRSLQDVDLKYSGTADQKHIAFDTEELKLLGGEWKLHAQMPGKHQGNHSDRQQVPEATLNFHDLQLADAAKLVQQSDVSGTAAGELDAELDQPSLDHLAITGHLSAANVHARQMHVDSATASLSLQQNQLALTPIHLENGSGHADAALSINLTNPELITASLDATNWPAAAADISAVLGANTKNLVIDAKSKTMSGQLSFNSSADFQSRHVLTARGTIALAGQTANLQSFDADALDGTATGTATFTLHHPLASRAQFEWHDVQLSALAPYQQRLEDAGGSFNGQAVIMPVDDPRALAPLLLTVDGTGIKSHVGPVQVAGFHLPVWIDGDDKNQFRAVLDQGRLDIADGSIGLFARVSQHVDNILTADLNAKLNELDVDQLINEVEMSSATTTNVATNAAGTPTTRNQKLSFPGRLNGSIDANGDPRNVRSLFANIDLQLHDSDLGNFGPFAALYNTMHLGGGGSKPDGNGSILARYDNDNFIITSLRYFNRGTYAYGIMQVNDIRKFPDSSLSGNLAGTFRPLDNIKLPFFADADKIFSVLQSNFTTIVPGGTVRNPTYTPQSAALLGSAMRSLLVGDTQTNK